MSLLYIIREIFIDSIYKLTKSLPIIFEFNLYVYWHIYTNKIYVQNQTKKTLENKV